MADRLYDNSDKVDPLRDNPLKQAKREAGRLDKERDRLLEWKGNIERESRGKSH